MGKKKNKRKRNSELLEKICSGKDGKKLNPFELKINKEKHQVLGRKQKKLIGLPTVTHKKSLLKRKNTLLQEYVHRNKKNVFFDKRLHVEGRKSAQVMQQRWFESDKNHYLDDNEELTHHGQLLSKIEKMEEPISDDSDNEQLPADFVEKAHFGGFLTEKKSEEPVKSHKDLINEIIAESKKRKYEKQSEREAGIEMTEKLDSEWKEIQHLIFKGAHKKSEEENKNINSYDMTVHQLKFELKAGVSDRTKKPEEIAKDHREKQIKLEMNRKGRMNMCFDDVTENNCELPQKSDDSVDALLPAVACTSNDTNKDNNESCCLTNDSINVLCENNTHNGICLNISNEASKINKIPSTLQEFIETTTNYSKEQLNSLISQIITNNRSQLDNLGMFFNIIVEYACYIADNEDSDMSVLNILIPHLYELAAISTKVAAQYLLHMLKTAEQDFEDTYKVKKKKLQYPKLGTLLMLKLCCMLFPSSDFRHLVTSPAILFIARILTECYVLTMRDILCGIFTCNLALECVSYSKRFFPEALNFLSGLLSLAVHKDYKSTLVTNGPPFADYKTALNLSETDIASTTANKLKLSDLQNSSKEIKNTSDLQLIGCSIELLLKFIHLYKELPSYFEIFSSVSSTCKYLVDMNYPEFLNDKICQIIELTKPTQCRKYLMQAKRPLKCLRFIEPKIEENFDGHKVHRGNKQHLEKEKLKHKYKREMKGAIREIRHDNYFLANHWLNEQTSKDRERKEKVRKLYQELANQEGDIRSLKRRKF